MVFNKSKTIISVFFIMLVLIISSTITFGISTNTDGAVNNNLKINTEKRSQIVCTKSLHSSKINPIIPLEDSLVNFEYENNSILANSTDDEYYPSLIADGKNMLVSYETKNETMSNVYMRKSSDYGQSWSQDPISFDLEYNVTSPRFTSLTTNNRFAFGTCITPENTSYVYEMNFPRPNTVYDWEANLWDYSYIEKEGTDQYIGTFFNFENPDIVSFSDPDIPWVIATVGDSEFIEGYEGYDCTNSPVFLYQDPVEKNTKRIIVFFPEIKNCNNISVCPGKTSKSKDIIYGVSEIKNGTKTDLIFFKGNPDIWTDEDKLNHYNLSFSQNFSNPKIFSKGSNIYIVAETDTDEIALIHSANYGSSWDFKNVTKEILTPSTNPKFPNIYDDGDEIFCLFIESGNLSLTTSNDIGLNWTDPVKINNQNNSVVSGYNNYDITNTDHIVWTDNREGNKDLYYYLGYVPQVDLKVKSFIFSKEMILFPFKNWIDITIENIGDGYAEDVIVNITYECDDGKTIATKYPTQIEYIDSYETKTVKTPLFRLSLSELFESYVDFAGIENMTVRVDPYQQTDDINFGNNALKKGVEYKDIFLRFWRFEFLFKLLKPII
jgi:hypothetical protein